MFILDIRRLKTYLRNTKSEDRLSGMALLNIHHDTTVDTGRSFDELCTKRCRLPFLLQC
jgi:hypothetical protein